MFISVGLMCAFKIFENANCKRSQTVMPDKQTCVIKMQKKKEKRKRKAYVFLCIYIFIYLFLAFARNVFVLLRFASFTAAIFQTLYATLNA